MNLEKIRIEDVYPNENNPRQVFDGIKELAASFDLNMERPGEPFIPPIVVRDGGIYHIVDGERRYRALKLRKATTFHANVCETMDEAQTLVAAMATDDKQPLTTEERSRGVQQMLLLGVDPVAVDKSARLESGSAGRVRTALKAVGDDTRAEEMTLDWLLAIEETSADPETQQKLMSSSAFSWGEVYAEYKREIKNDKKEEEFKAVLTEAAVPIYTDEGRPPAKYDYVGNFFSSSKLQKELDKRKGQKLLAKIDRYYSCEVDLYAETDQGTIARKNERQEQEDAFKKVCRSHKSRIFAWYELNRFSSDALPMTKERAIDALTAHHLSRIAEYQEEAGIEDSVYAYGSYDLALGLYYAWPEPISLSWHIFGNSASTPPQFVIERARNYMAFIDDVLDDGYVPQDDELDLFAKVHDFIAENAPEQEDANVVVSEND